MLPRNTVDEFKKQYFLSQKPTTLTKGGTFVLTHNQSLETLLLGLFSENGWLPVIQTFIVNPYSKKKEFAAFV